MENKLNFTQIIEECTFRTSRSGGKGGQNVNKVSTKVEILFNILSSAILDQTQKEILLRAFPSKINKEGELFLVSQSERTQLGNKKIAIKKLLILIESAFLEKKERLETRIPKSVSEKRKEVKRRTAIIKKDRSFRFDN